MNESVFFPLGRMVRRYYCLHATFDDAASACAIMAIMKRDTNYFLAPKGTWRMSRDHSTLAWPLVLQRIFFSSTFLPFNAIKCGFLRSALIRIGTWSRNSDWAGFKIDRSRVTGLSVKYLFPELNSKWQMLLIYVSFLLNNSFNSKEVYVVIFVLLSMDVNRRLTYFALKMCFFEMIFMHVPLNSERKWRREAF